MNLEQTVLQVHIEDIIPNRFQPRLMFDEQGLQELAASIKEHGIIQPLVLRKLGDKYEIIAGERRYKAAQMAGLQTVPAVIANIDDQKSAELALVENVQRRDLTPIEEARSYKALLDKNYLTQDELAKRMGISQSAVANKLRLLNLDPEVQQALLDEKISERHARTLLKLQDKEEQKEWLHRIINERLTVRQLDMELRNLGNNGTVMNNMEENDIPLAGAAPSIEEIKANAMDIGQINKPNNNPEPEKLDTLEMEDTSNTQEENSMSNQTTPSSNMLGVNSINNNFNNNISMENNTPSMDNVPSIENNQSMNNNLGMNNQMNNIPNNIPSMDNNMNTIPNNPVMGNMMNNNIPNNMNNNPMNNGINPNNGEFVTNNTVPQFNIATPESVNTMVNQDNVNLNNRFFDNKNNNISNNMGNIPNNMNNSSMSSPMNNQNAFTNPVNNNLNNNQNGNFEVFGKDNSFVNMDNSMNNPFNQPEPPKEIVKPAFNTQINQGINQFSPSNKFFTPLNTSDEINIQNNKQDTMVNPMDMVDRITNPNQNPTESNQKDLKYAIDTVRDTISGLGNEGFFIEVEEIDLPAEYQITMKIEK